MPQVGNQFVSQYYTVQHASPKHLHRFYSDASTLTYGDVRPEGCVTRNATGQKASCAWQCCAEDVLSIRLAGWGSVPWLAFQPILALARFRPIRLPHESRPAMLARLHTPTTLHALTHNQPTWLPLAVC